MKKMAQWAVPGGRNHEKRHLGLAKGKKIEVSGQNLIPIWDRNHRIERESWSNLLIARGLGRKAHRSNPAERCKWAALSHPRPNAYSKFVWQHRPVRVEQPVGVRQLGHCDQGSRLSQQRSWFHAVVEKRRESHAQWGTVRIPVLVSGDYDCLLPIHSDVIAYERSERENANARSERKESASYFDLNLLWSKYSPAREPRGMRLKLDMSLDPTLSLLIFRSLTWSATAQDADDEVFVART